MKIKSFHLLTPKHVSILEVAIKNHLPFFDISLYDETFILKSIERHIQETNCVDFESYVEFLQHNINEIDNLISSLQNCYTSFFRNPLTFAVLENIILPELFSKIIKNKRKEIRIWSAACASGPEVYSIAMLLEEITNNWSEKTNYRIFATDLSELQIDEAKKGIYAAASIENLSIKRVNKWLTKKGDSYIVNPELKNNIDFSVFNLFNHNQTAPPASIFGDFDIIFCANLLFYYKPKYRRLILEKVSKNIANGGYVVTGESERNILMRNNYKEVNLQSAIFQL